MRVGDPIWRFNENRRHYAAPAPGKLYGEIIWREHWEKLVVIGETRVSWIVGHKTWECARVSKRDLRDGKLSGWVTSESEVDDRVWVHDNRNSIVELVRRTVVRSKLAQIAEIVGYEDPTPPPPFDPELYECESCSSKSGTPTLCDRCYEARAKAGSRWKGVRPPAMRDGGT